MRKPDVPFDRAMARETIEEFLRSNLQYQRDLIFSQPHLTPEQTQGAAMNRQSQFFERIDATANMMSQHEGEAYRNLLLEEYELFMHEFERNPQGVFRRLGFDFSNQQMTTMMLPPRRMGLGELAVRTAVRATVWESIWSLFRWR
jgi:hypothetical protein